MTALKVAVSVSAGVTKT